MKTTLDLPADLVRRVKVQALRDGKKVKDAVAELLRRGLAARKAPTRRSSRVQLPLVQCKRAAERTPACVTAILVEQDAAWHRETSGRPRRSRLPGAATLIELGDQPRAIRTLRDRQRQRQR